MSRRTPERDAAVVAEEGPDADEAVEATSGADAGSDDPEAAEVAVTIEEPVDDKPSKEDAEAALRQLWVDYKDSAREELRERLILHYAPLVKYVAGRVGVGLPPNIEQADLVSYGIFGLIDAIEKYDLERGIKFETYAITRIRGAIIDELRNIDWIPRSVRMQGPRGRARVRRLEAELHRTPTERRGRRATWGSPSGTSTRSSARCPSSTSSPSTSC